MAGPVGMGARSAQYTGSYIVCRPAPQKAALTALRSGAGLGDAQSRCVRRRPAPQSVASGETIVFDEIGVAVVPAEPDQRQALTRTAAESPNVLAMERSGCLRIRSASPEYLRGYRDGVSSLVSTALGETPGRSGGAGITAVDETRATWGCRRSAPWSRRSRVPACGSASSTLASTRRTRPRGRIAKTESFIAGELEDGHGHGTHCIGTAFGPKDPQTLPRYGVAYDAEVFAGKVLSDAGSGADRGILAGINWGISEGCRVISMSLGAPTQVGDTFSRVYEAVAQRAMRKGTMIVAAAGNESNRPTTIAPVGHPANCPSILAVAAIDSAMQVARFSCAGLNPEGGQVDIAAPGVDVYSSWPDDSYRRLNGTSMATPHVAGVVALLAEANPKATVAELKDLLITSALRLPLASTDVGAGLVQAP